MSKKLSYKQVKKEVEDKECELISKEYRNIDAPLIIKCKCGREYSRTLYNFRKGSGNCFKCYCKGVQKRVAIPKDEIQKRLSKSEYLLISTSLNGGDQLIVIQCNNGHIYETKLNKFGSGRRCPKCNSSTGEKRISDFLKSRNIPFKREYHFSDLKGVGGGFLRFDFAIFDNANENIECLIEYDGKQHFEETPFMKDSKKIQEHDKRKDDYCSNHNLKLIRISFKQFTQIEKILANKI